MINELKERGGTFSPERVKGDQELRFVPFVRECNNIKRTCEYPSQIRIRVLMPLREGDAFVRGTSSVYTYACPACRLITRVINNRKWPGCLCLAKIFFLLKTFIRTQYDE